MEKGFGEEFESNERRNPPVSDLVSAYAGVRKYNVSIQDPITVHPPHPHFTGDTQVIGESVIKQALEGTSYEELKDKYGNSLHAMGIELLPGPNHKGEPILIGIRIADFTPKFAEYLHEVVKSGNLGNNRDLAKTLFDLGRQLNEGIESDVSKSETGRVVDKMSGLVNLAEEYQRLDPDKKYGLSVEASRMMELADWYKKNELVEHIAFERWGLNVPIEEWGNSSGPWSWHLENRTNTEVAMAWAGVTDILRMLRHVPELFKKALMQLKTANRMAQKDLDHAVKTSDPKYEAGLQKRLQVIEDAYIVLQDIDFEE